MRELRVIGLKQRGKRYVIQIQDGKPPYGKKGEEMDYTKDTEKLVLGEVYRNFGHDYKGMVKVWFENYGYCVTINVEKE